MPELAARSRAGTALDRERRTVTGVLMLLVVLWAGFLFHRDSRFAGSVPGTVLAVTGATLLVVPSLAYAMVKHVVTLKRRLTTPHTMRRLLAWHVYGGITGAILAILHTGHRFNSALGMALTAAMRSMSSG